MKFRHLILILWLLLCQRAQATVLAGTFTYANGGNVSGVLSVRLERNGLRNTCSTPSVVVPTNPVLIQVLNGSIQGSPDLTPTDCLSMFQPYAVDLRAGQTIIGHWWLWLTQAGGAVSSPTDGNKYVVRFGMTALANGNERAFSVPQTLAGFRVSTGIVSVGSGPATANITLNWPTAFADTTYTVVCSAIDGTLPLAPTVHVSSIGTLTSTSVPVTVTNDSGGAAKSVTVTCRGRASS